MKNKLIVLGLLCLPMLFSACSRKLEPVELYPDDMCSHCRMAISEPSFAAEILTPDGEALKFDDIGCMKTYLGQAGVATPAMTFVKDYTTREWRPMATSVILVTNIQTPMGSGYIAFADSNKAREFERVHPSSSVSAGIDTHEYPKNTTEIK